MKDPGPLSPTATAHPAHTHFLTIPWTHILLTSPGTTILPRLLNRELKPSTEDQLFADTLSTPDTIPFMLSFYTSAPPSTTVPSAAPRSSLFLSQDRAIPVISTLVALGYRLNGYPHVVHGGIISTIIDESMGIFLSRNQALGAFSPDGRPTMGEGGSGDMVTAELKVRFLRPVTTPGVVRVDVCMAGREGRRYYVEATMTDDKGERLAVGEGVWVAMRGEKL